MDYKNLRLTFLHLGLWLGLAMASAVIAVLACLRYNEVAGMDKTLPHIAAIATAVLAGPLVGPVANPDGGGHVRAIGLTAVMACSVLGSLAPFVFVKRPVSKLAFGFAWAGFILVSVVWFLSALVSMGMYLS
jgi:hypothetical protein